MKKMFNLVVVLSMVMVLVSCGDKQSSGTSGGSLSAPKDAEIVNPIGKNYKKIDEAQGYSEYDIETYYTDYYNGYPQRFYERVVYKDDISKYPIFLVPYYRRTGDGQSENLESTVDLYINDEFACRANAYSKSYEKGIENITENYIGHYPIASNEFTNPNAKDNCYQYIKKNRLPGVVQADIWTVGRPRDYDKTNWYSINVKSVEAPDGYVLEEVAFFLQDCFNYSRSGKDTEDNTMNIGGLYIYLYYAEINKAQSLIMHDLNADLVSSTEARKEEVGILFQPINYEKDGKNYYPLYYRRNSKNYDSEIIEISSNGEVIGIIDEQNKWTHPDYRGQASRMDLYYLGHFPINESDDFSITVDGQEIEPALTKYDHSANDHTNDYLGPRYNHSGISYILE